MWNVDDLLYVYCIQANKQFNMCGGLGKPIDNRPKLGFSTYFDTSNISK